MKVQSAHVFALITGGSRGFGARVAEQFLSQVMPLRPASVTLNLHASSRSVSKLDALKASLQAFHRNMGPTAPLRINTIALDLSQHGPTLAAAHALLRHHTIQPEDLDDDEKLLLAATAPDGATVRRREMPDIAILFTNAGVLQAGRIDSGLPVGPDGLLSQSLAINTVAAATIMSAFLTTFQPPTTARYLAYTSTICAVAPFPAWSAYSVSKAATEMLHMVAAREHPDTRVLLYAPGPMDTDMGKSITKDSNTDAEIAGGIARMLASGTMVDPDQSAGKFMRLLLEDQYENCRHVDFFDA